MRISENGSSDPPEDRFAYYQEMRTLAREKRSLYVVETDKLDIPFLERIYKSEQIKIDRRRMRGNKVRASYFCDDGECSVLLNQSLPRAPKMFTLAHELKHHYVDEQLIRDRRIRCGDYNRNEFIEKSAEVFAAEFLYPEAEMRALAASMGIDARTCTKEKVIDFKRACPACVSYIFIVKRFERFGFCTKGAYNGVKFQNLEEEIHGLPVYKQEWFKKRRTRKKDDPDSCS
jgi:Zn-dependent peptidase ImmA (M78 family)